MSESPIPTRTRHPLRVLVNATTLVVGGGVQVGLSFVEHAARLPPERYGLMFTVSRSIYESLRPELRTDPRVLLIEPSPSGIHTGSASRRALLRLEETFQPDIVYSIGFPSYVRFRTTEVGRYTNPWEINHPPLPWRVLPMRERPIVWLRARYRAAWARRAAFYETQTSAGRDGIVQRFGVASERVRVVPNSADPRFLVAGSGNPPPPTDGPFRVLSLAAPYRHKNLESIPAVAAEFRRLLPERSVEFVVTIPPGDRLAKDVAAEARRLGVESLVRNAGSLKLDECVDWYRASHVVFLPTLLEVFSATYLEAMAMGRPIVTTDLPFARAICAGAALYYNPSSPRAAAAALAALAREPARRQKFADLGRLQLATFPNSARKYEMVFAWFESLVERQRSARPLGGAIGGLPFNKWRGTTIALGPKRRQSRNKGE